MELEELKNAFMKSSKVQGSVVKAIEEVSRPYRFPGYIWTPDEQKTVVHWINTVMDNVASNSLAYDVSNVYDYRNENADADEAIELYLNSTGNDRIKAEVENLDWDDLAERSKDRISSEMAQEYGLTYQTIENYFANDQRVLCMPETYIEQVAATLKANAADAYDPADYIAAVQSNEQLIKNYMFAGANDAFDFHSLTYESQRPVYEKYEAQIYEEIKAKLIDMAKNNQAHASEMAPEDWVENALSRDKYAQLWKQTNFYDEANQAAKDTVLNEIESMVDGDSSDAEQFIDSRVQGDYFHTRKATFDQLINEYLASKEDSDNGYVSLQKAIDYANKLIQEQFDNFFNYDVTLFTSLIGNYLDMPKVEANRNELLDEAEFNNQDEYDLTRIHDAFNHYFPANGSVFEAENKYASVVGDKAQEILRDKSHYSRVDLYDAAQERLNPYNMNTKDGEKLIKGEMTPDEYVEQNLPDVAPISEDDPDSIIEDLLYQKISAKYIADRDDYEFTDEMIAKGYEEPTQIITDEVKEWLGTVVNAYETNHESDPSYTPEQAVEDEFDVDEVDDIKNHNVDIYWAYIDQVNKMIEDYCDEHEIDDVPEMDDNSLEDECVDVVNGKMSIENFIAEYYPEVIDQLQENDKRDDMLDYANQILSGYQLLVPDPAGASSFEEFVNSISAYNDTEEFVRDYEDSIIDHADDHADDFGNYLVENNDDYAEMAPADAFNDYRQKGDWSEYADWVKKEYNNDWGHLVSMTPIGDEYFYDPEDVVDYWMQNYC